MKSPSVPVVAMKETKPELWFNPEDRREKRWRKYAHRWLDANPRLAGVGEDRQ
jgi:hypothetical protein